MPNRRSHGLDLSRLEEQSISTFRASWLILPYQTLSGLFQRRLSWVCLCRPIWVTFRDAVNHNSGRYAFGRHYFEFLESSMHGFRPQKICGHLERIKSEGRIRRSEFTLPGRAFPKVNKVESLATKHDVKSKAFSFLCNDASSDSNSSCKGVFPDIFRVPPEPVPNFSTVSLEVYEVWESS